MSVGVGGGGGARGSRWSGLPPGAEVSGAEDPGAAGESFSVCGEQMKGGCWLHL